MTDLREHPDTRPTPAVAGPHGTGTRPSTGIRASDRDRTRRRAGVGFWGVAYTFVAIMAFSTVPTPLYPLYEQAGGFGSSTVTVIFSMYALGVLLSLFLAGHISDWYGRKPLLWSSLAVALVSTALFLSSTDLAVLLIARFTTGLAVGVLTATATAALTALRSAHRPGGAPGVAETVAVFANIGGLGLGPLVSGVVAQFAPAPLVWPYVLFAILLVAAVPLLVLTPETAGLPAKTVRYRPQRLALHPTRPAVHLAAIALGLISFSVFGVFSSLAPQLLGDVFGITATALTGATVFAVFAAGAVAQALAGRIPPQHRLKSAAVTLWVGLALVAVQPFLPSYPLFVAGGMVAGVGAGLAFKTAVGTIVALTSPEKRASALATLFLGSYIGLSLPVLGLGALAPVITLPLAVAALTAVLAAGLVPVYLTLRRG
ncbi:MFS transporter [Herbiconiux sp. CPCC 203407]|uniref:MFS transporter n=1 Tax=Herbiconiux oxytropis TaxID=2970915 RepID=A0AA41XJA3_9MICO|nr:MFS transporter [Herbiconiux oxytropis]MCS5723351.1 MFS transporter [Herbiconiux oxytropis]MCS5727530.1 MFS transporter [Herbiconiux oxytropis]